MSSTFFPASEGSALASSEPECEPLPSAKSSHSRGLSLLGGGPASLVTTTLEPLLPIASGQTAFPLTLFAEDFPARTSALPGGRRGSKPRGAASGLRSLDLLATFDRNSSSWRTSQTSLVALVNNEAGGLDKFSATWPRSGLMRNGIAYRRPQSALHMVGTEFGCLPTPTKSDASAHHSDIQRFDSLSVELRKTHGHPSRPLPSYLEWMMGFPIGWTDVQPLEMPLSPNSLKSSGEPS